MAKLANLARMTTATTGTGTITLGAAVAGFKTFAQAGITDGMRVSYAIKDGSNSELGEGVYTSSGTTLTRVVTSSTNSDSAINLSGTAEVAITPSAASLLRIVSPGGRLTLTTATPVITTTTSAQTTVYYTPYIHRFVPLYDGTSYEVHDLVAELSQATTDNTKSPAACTTNSNYDVFVWIDGTTYRATRGPAWSSDTARGTGAGTTELELVQGIWLNKVAITNGPAANRGTYVGTIRTNGSSQVDMIFGGTAAGGTAGFFGLWNAYNRVAHASVSRDNTDSWTYNSTTPRSSNNSTAMRFSFISGLAIETIIAQFAQPCLPNVSANVSVGFGLDSTSTFAKVATAGGTAVSGNIAYGKLDPQIGFHFVQALEASTGPGVSVTFYGDAGTTVIQNEYVGMVML